MTDTNDDGVPLESAEHPIEVTEAMLDAGVAAHAVTCREGWLSDNSHKTVAAVFRAMVRAAPLPPEDLNEQSLEQAMIDVRLHEDMVERFAQRCAMGNNGGEWAIHYTEEQKNHWRQFVRELAEEVFLARIYYRTTPCPPNETS